MAAATKTAPPLQGSFTLNARMESYSVFTVAVNTTGSPASYSVQLEGSMDNTNWKIIGSAITSDGVSAQTTSNIFYPFVRANLTAVSGGTSPKITMYYVASS